MRYGDELIFENQKILVYKNVFHDSLLIFVEGAKVEMNRDFLLEADPRDLHRLFRERMGAFLLEGDIRQMPKELNKLLKKKNDKNGI